MCYLGWETKGDSAQLLGQLEAAVRKLQADFGPVQSLA